MTLLRPPHRSARERRSALRLSTCASGKVTGSPFGLVVLVVCLLVSGCQLGFERILCPEALETPSFIPTATQQPPTPTIAALPTSTPAPTTAPTLDRSTVAQTIDAGQEIISQRGVEPLCLHWVDADDDGSREWVGVYLQPGEPPRLLGFVLDDGAWHPLHPPSGEEPSMGEFPTCELQIYDVNKDGRTELLVRGHRPGPTDLLFVFVREGQDYRLLASFHAEAGIEIVDIDGDLIAEIISRYEAGSGLVWEAVHSWDGSHYAWTWERYGWLYPDHPHAYPTDEPGNAIIAFYLALAARDLPGAYNLLSSEARNNQTYEGWAAGFDTMLDVEVGSIREIERGGDAAQVAAQVRAYDNANGYVIGRLWDVTWTVVREGEGWRLRQSVAEELEEWEVAYYE